MQTQSRTGGNTRRRTTAAPATNRARGSGPASTVFDNRIRGRLGFRRARTCHIGTPPGTGCGRHRRRACRRAGRCDRRPRVRWWCQRHGVRATRPARSQRWHHVFRARSRVQYHLLVHRACRGHVRISMPMDDAERWEWWRW